MSKILAITDATGKKSGGYFTKERFGYHPMTFQQGIIDEILEYREKGHK